MKARSRIIYKTIFILLSLMFLFHFGNTANAEVISGSENTVEENSDADVSSQLFLNTKNASNNDSGIMNKSDPVLLIGDSYLSGVNMDQPGQITDNNWGKITTDILDLSNVRYVSEIGAGFVNTGKNGNNFQNLLKKSMSSNQKGDYRLIIIAAGYNDVWHGYNSIRSNAADFLKLIKKTYPKANVVLAMIGGNSKNKDISQKLHNTVAKAYRDAAKSVGISYLEGGENILEADEKYYSKDGYHPNDNGYYKIAKFVARGINQYFKNSNNEVKICYHQNGISGESKIESVTTFAEGRVSNYFSYSGLNQIGWSEKEDADTVELKAGDLIESDWIRKNAPITDLYAVWEIPEDIQKIIPYKGEWYYVENGAIQKKATGIAERVTDKELYFVQNGKINWNYTGIAKSFADDRWYFVRNGKVDYSYTGIAQSVANGRWYFVRKGVLDWNYTGIAQSIATKRWYFVRKGAVDWSYTGIAKSIANSHWYFVRKGELDWNYTGIAQSVANGHWYFVRKGELDWGYTGVAQSVANSRWYFVRKGEVDWSYTGIAKSVANGRWYFVRKGELDWSFTGIAQSIANGHWYFVRKGALDWNYTGIAQSIANGHWYFVRKGELDWSYTGVARSVADNRLYYVQKGEVNWKYSGYAVFYVNHKKYRIVNGRAV